ncbi:MAG TPA: PD-(D/E)XK nuclease family protein [Anaerovoracaceae bacterium]|nr:PD-(D/E)XK nuclease family protein [Anaerovoracaceae bacterium]
MLHIYFGRENVDKERAMFEKIAQIMPNLGETGYPSQILLLVPDQYTLQMERNAISNLKVKGLMDLEVLSFSRLTERILDETGGSKRIPIDKHGRHMLLTKVINDENENLSVFRGLSKSHAFIDMTNNLISDMKQHNSTPDEIKNISEEIGDSRLLKDKLKDISIIFQRYEDLIQGKYIDTEDHLNFFISKIGQSETVKRTEFWITGFDSFTPKSIEIIKELVKHSFGVNIVITSDDRLEDEELFRITREMMYRLEEAVGPMQVKRSRLEGPLTFRSPPVMHIERNIFSYPYFEFAGDADSLCLCRAANYYNEAETAASYICELVRDKGLRFRDIAVICNDTDVRGAIIRKVFDEYEISYFMDEKQQGLHNPVIIFITALLDVIQSSLSYEDVFRMVKTGLCPISISDAEELENYAIRYRIKGNRWACDFIYGNKEYDEDEFQRLNESRQDLYKFIMAYKNRNSDAVTVKARTTALYEFLMETVNIEFQLEIISRDLENSSEFEAAMEMQQIWESIVDLFNQLIELIGDESVSHEDYSAMLKAGFESLELGLIPTTIDQVVVGTMQRTRVGHIKALIVLGANDGVLPADIIDDELLSKDEKAYLLDREIQICKNSDFKVFEERLAIYKQLSRPEKYLWIGFSSADMDGKEIRSSIIFDRIRGLFPETAIEKDLLNREEPILLVDRPDSSLKHLASALQMSENEGTELDPVWKSAYNWYRENDSRRLNLIIKGLNFTNRIEKLESSLIYNIFGSQSGRQGEDTEDTLKISPSRLEKFSRCPFAHFVHYGLTPKEKRIFQLAGREVGDVYHRCLMMFSDRLTIQGLPLTHKDSPWMKLTKEECGAIVASLMDKIAAEYREGILGYGEEEKYRTERMREVCEKAAWALAEHVKQGQIDEIYFEEGFGRGRLFPPIEITAAGQKFLIEGIIDRVDVLPRNYIKVIDYKSGKERFNPKEALGGWKLQLMIYLAAVIEGMKTLNREAKPAGVFYFEISDSMIDAEGFDEKTLKEKLESELRKQYKLDGVVLDEHTVVNDIAGDFNGYSDILPIRKNKDGKISGTSAGRVLTEEEFSEFQKSMNQIIISLCESLADGVISIKPKKNKDETACRYCDYKSICNFELSFDGCAYDVVK